MVTKLTGLKYHGIQSIADSLCKGNMVTLIREPELDKNPEGTCDGLAYRADCKGVCIGYLPLIRTLRKYYKEAKSDSKRHLIEDWAKSVIAVRRQMKLDTENTGQIKWTAKVWDIRYTDGAEHYKTHDEVDRLEDSSGWKLDAVSIECPFVEPF